MPKYHEYKVIKARKDMVCVHCMKPIEKGLDYVRLTVFHQFAWDKIIRMHIECRKDCKEAKSEIRRANKIHKARELRSKKVENYTALEKECSDYKKALFHIRYSPGDPVVLRSIAAATLSRYHDTSLIKDKR